MATLTPQQKWVAARLMARRKAKYMSPLIMKLVVRECEGLGTVGVTHHGFLLVDYEWIAKHTVAQCAGLWLHEALHPFLRHHQRRGHRDPRRFNRAGDRAINVMVREMGLELPDGGCWPKDIEMEEGLTTDAYYDGEPSQDGGTCGNCGEPLDGDDQSDGQQQGQAGQDGAQEDEQQGQGQSNSGDQDGQQGAASGQQSGNDGRCPNCGHKQQGKGSGNAGGEGGWGGNCGSGAGGVPLPGEPDAADPGARSDGEIHRAVREVAEAIKQEASSGRGTVPGSLVRMADELLKPPVVPWEQKLRRAARRTVAYVMGAFDYRYDAPSRRQAGVGYGYGKPVLPRMRCPTPEVVIVVDTSGSMGARELSRAVSESAGIMRSMGTPVTFLCCDAEVAGVQRIMDPTKIELKGGGGTSFVPAFDAVVQLRPRPSVCVFITDGCGDAPVTPPQGIETIWVLVGPYQRKPFPADGNYSGEINWGTFINVPTEKEEAA